MATREQLKSYFERGDTPTASQFAALIDSFRLISEAIAIGDIQGLSNALAGKAATGDVDNRALQSDLVALQNVVAGLGQSKETSITIAEGTNTISYNWQTQVDPSGNGVQTLAQRHGNSRVRIYGIWSSGDGFQNYTPNMVYQKDGGGNITNFTVNDLQPGILIII